MEGVWGGVPYGALAPDDPRRLEGFEELEIGRPARRHAPLVVVVRIGDKVCTSDGLDVATGIAELGERRDTLPADRTRRAAEKSARGMPWE